MEIRTHYTALLHPSAPGMGDPATSAAAVSSTHPVGPGCAASPNYECPNPSSSIEHGYAFISQHPSARSDLVLPDQAKGWIVGPSMGSMGSDSAYSSRRSSCEIDVPPAGEPTHSSESYLSDSSEATSSASSSMISAQVHSRSDLDGVERTFEPPSSRDSLSTTTNCPICEEPASGMHYGVETCSPCKNFFRRAVRSGKILVCMADNNCELKNRAMERCRACRIRKCLAVGMNKKAVQSPRDTLVQRKRKNTQESPKAKIRKIADFSSIFPSGEEAILSRTAATLQDVADRLNNLTATVFFWARSSPGFSKFSNADQSALVHNHRIPHLLLEIAARSSLCYPHLLMGDKFIIDARPMAPTQAIAEIISHEIMGPFREIELTETELGLMKYFIFYDSTLPWIADIPLISEWQTATFITLRKLVRSGPDVQQDRFQKICSLVDSWNTASFEISKILREAGLLQQIFA